MELELVKSIDKYYALKNEYSLSIEKEKNKLKGIKGLSWKEKRREFIKIKPKCVNCKRPVGTIFSIKLVDETNRHILAICGDKVAPCPLNIDIDLGYTKDVRIELKNDNKLLDKYKQMIIKDKNDLIFGYINSETAVEKFDNLKEDISTTTSTYEMINDIFLSVTDNPEKIEQLNKDITKLNIFIDEYKKMDKKYNETANNQYLKDIVYSYINNLIPLTQNINGQNKIKDNLLKKIMNEKYEYSAIEVDEFNDNDDIKMLVQKQFSVENFEINFGESNVNIVSMKIGMDPISSSSQISSSISSSSPISSSISSSNSSSLQSRSKMITSVKEESKDDIFGTSSSSGTIPLLSKTKINNLTNIKFDSDSGSESD